MSEHIEKPIEKPPPAGESWESHRRLAEAGDFQPPVESNEQAALTPRSEAQEKILQAEDYQIETESQQMLVESGDQQLHKDYGEFIPPEQHLRDKVHFQENAEFQKQLLERDPTTKHPDLVLGYYNPSDGQIYINNDQPGKYRTVLHEGLHSYSVRIEQSLGERMNEGMTEYFTEQSAPFNLYESGYEQEKEIVSMLSNRVGDETLKSTYFTGDIRPLEQAVDGQLGSGALKRIRDLVEEGKYDEARVIIQRGI
ncbi:TPA: hypothetical protein EYP66_15740 [Candidatus Poribacteria bacterium]|nr:hypothetical protein [Candidatus Poribacteria bacterium]